MASVSSSCDPCLVFLAALPPPVEATWRTVAFVGSDCEAVSGKDPSSHYWRRASEGLAMVCPSRTQS